MKKYIGIMTLLLNMAVLLGMSSVVNSEPVEGDVIYQGQNLGKMWCTHVIGRLDSVDCYSKDIEF